MKLEFNVSWFNVLRKLRVIFLLGVFYGLYAYIEPTWAFLWILWFIMNDISDIEVDVTEIKEKGDRAWKNISTQRKGF